uniref:Uncharacterized protein n=1 Tax=Poecilia mexicana TaxID=48701 RepID=A0A3B3YME1_9TELE
MEVNIEARRILAVSISKLYASRTQRGGLRLHRSLLLSLVMKSARDIYHSSRESEAPSGGLSAPEEGNPKAFPVQPRDIVPPACPGSSQGPPPRGTCKEHLTREAPGHAFSKQLFLNSRGSTPEENDMEKLPTQILQDALTSVLHPALPSSCLNAHN